MNLEQLLCAELKRQLEAKGVAMMTIPAGGELLWRWFMDLARSRSWHMSGPNPICYSEIQSYAAAWRWPIEPRHIAILRAMDEVWLEHVQKRAAALPEGVKACAPVSSTPITANMIDALFG